MRISGSCVFNGLAKRHPDLHPWLDEPHLARLREDYLVEAAARLPDIPKADLEALIDGGIIEGQGQFQNKTKSPLGYGVLDGREAPMALVHTLDRPKREIRTVELFTDGYFEPGAEPAIAAWEVAFKHVEATDQDKRHHYPSVTGTIGRIRADDRTEVIVSNRAFRAAAGPPAAAGWRGPR